MARLLASVALLTAITALPAGARSDPCSRHRNCVQCASDSKCRWTIGYACKPRSTHPNVSILSQGTYIDDPAECNVLNGPQLRCWQRRDCNACLTDPACSWCTAIRSLIQHRCQAANDDEACPRERLTRDKAVCEPNELGKPLPCRAPSSCDDYIACSQCTHDPACGWCNATERCIPQTEGASCAGSFTESFYACRPVERPPTRRGLCVDPCAEHSDCRACARDQNCGWCRGENRCRWGTTNVSTCSSGWAKSERMCAQWEPDTCVQHRECMACMSAGGCHWCPDSKRCERETGVCGGEIYYSKSQCPGATQPAPVPVTPARAPKQRLLHLLNVSPWSVEFAVMNTRGAFVPHFTALSTGERSSTTIRPGQALHVRRADLPRVKARFAFGNRLARNTYLVVAAKGRGALRLRRGAK